MKVVVHQASFGTWFSFETWFSVICSLMTLSNYSHASIIDNRGKRWDASFKRGWFGVAAALNRASKRVIAVIDLPDKDCEQFCREKLYTRYDTWGVALWPFAIQQSNKMYCFEVVDEALKAAGIDLKLGKRPSGKRILRAFEALGYEINYMTEGKFASE